jgi:hypothetical protein
LKVEGGNVELGGGGLSVNGDVAIGTDLSMDGITTMQDASAQNLDLSGHLVVSGHTTIGGTLSVTGNETVTGTLSVAEETTLTGNVGIGGASGTEKLLVTGSERVTGNLDVSGDLTVTGKFYFSEVIQNITTVNNEVIISTQLDISNQGTGPALKVSQFGAGDGQDVALFNAGTEGDAFKIDSSGNSHFYKPVNITNVSFDTMLIRRPDATGVTLNLRTLQVYVSNVNILPSATNDTQSIGSGSLGEVIEFMTWNDLVANPPVNSGLNASRIRENNIVSLDVVYSQTVSYQSLYIPLTQSFNVSDIQSFVLYNKIDANRSRINGFQNRTHSFPEPMFFIRCL